MDGRKDREIEGGVDPLGGLSSAPVPEGMARRAVEQWAQERERRASRMRLVRGFSLSAAGLAAAALLVVRMRPPSEVVGPVTPPSHAGPERAAGRANAGAAAKGRFTVAVRRRAPSHTSHGSHSSYPTDRADLVYMPPSPAQAAVASAADLAYLNAEPPPAEQPGAVSDVRLAALVTVREEAGVPDLLGLLRSRTGVEVAVPDGVARMQVALNVTDEPLRDVMQQMGKTLEVRWYRSGAGAKSRYAAVPMPASPADADTGSVSGPIEQSPK